MQADGNPREVAASLNPGAVLDEVAASSTSASSAGPLVISQEEAMGPFPVGGGLRQEEEERSQDPSSPHKQFRCARTTITSVGPATL